MFKTIVTLMRGAAFRAEEELTDRSALLILDQQIRDAAAGIERPSARSPSPLRRTRQKESASKRRSRASPTSKSARLRRSTAATRNLPRKPPKRSP